MRRPRAASARQQRSAFAGFRFPPQVITVAVRWCLGYGLSYRDVEELLAERASMSTRSPDGGAVEVQVAVPAW